MIRQHTISIRTDTHVHVTTFFRSGIANFGIYRAVSNVAAPVRLVLDPLRPVLSGASLTTLRSPRGIWIPIGISVAFGGAAYRSEEHTSALQSLIRISYPVFCLKKKISTNQINCTLSIVCTTK